MIGSTQLRMLEGADFRTQTHNRSEELVYSFASQWERCLLADLNISSGADWQLHQGLISDVLVHGMTEKGVRARIEHLLKNLAKHGDETINLYYLTNARGLFNFENSTSTVLTNWFANSLKIDSHSQIEQLHHVIKGVLSESKDSWLENLPRLKSDILSAIRNTLKQADIQWPMAPEGEFDPVFDEEAHLQKRTPLEHSWPTATHMVQALINELAQIYDPSLAKRINVYPVNVKGFVDEAGRYHIANTVATLEAFKQSYANKLKGVLAVVTDNSVSHGAYRQMYLTNSILSKVPHSGIYDAALPSKVNMQSALEQLAKMLYATQETKPFETKVQDSYKAKSKMEMH